MIATKFFRSRFVHVLIVLVVGSIAYANTFHVPFLFDDKHYIVNNPAIRDFRFFADPSLIRSLGGVASNIKSAFFTRLLGNFTFALNYRIDGLNVSGYHMFNLVVHLANALLVYLLVSATMETVQRSEPVIPKAGSSLNTQHSSLAALFAALIFVSHPIQTQAVTYVSQRFVPLATFFSLLTFAGYVGFRSATSSLRSYALYICSLLAMACAMVSKEISFTIPLLLALYEYLFYPGPLKKRLLCLLPFGLTMFIIPLALLASKGSMAGFGNLGASMSSLASSPPMTRWEYLFTQFRVIVTYIRLFFFPVNQNLDYDYPIFHSFFTPQVFLSFLFLLALFGVAVYLVYRSMFNVQRSTLEARNPNLETPNSQSGAERLIAFGIIWFFVTLSVESSIVPIFDVIFEHRLYLPSIGLIMALVTLLFSLAQRFRTDARNPLHGLIAALIVVVGIFTGAAYARNRVWGDEERFWTDVVNKSPLKARPHNYLGTTYFKKQRFAEASAEYQKAIALNPRYAVAQFNLCLLKAQLGNAGEAVTACTAAIDLDPAFGPAHDQLGILYAQQGRYDESLAEFRTALRINPDDAVAVRNMGIAVGLRNRGVTK